jgi:hypothetical protein
MKKAMMRDKRMKERDEGGIDTRRNWTPQEERQQKN